MIRPIRAIGLAQTPAAAQEGICFAEQRQLQMSGGQENTYHDCFSHEPLFQQQAPIVIWQPVDSMGNCSYHDGLLWAGTRGTQVQCHNRNLSKT